MPLAHPGPSPPLRVSCHHRQGTRMHLAGGKPGWVSSALNAWTETLPVTTLPWRRRPVLSWAARHRRGSLSLSKFRAKKLPTSLVLFLLVSICFHLFFSLSFLFLMYLSVGSRHRRRVLLSSWVLLNIPGYKRALTAVPATRPHPFPWLCNPSAC